VRVGMDARKLWDGGIGTYIRQLVSALCALERPPACTLFVDPEHAGTHRWPPGCDERTVRAGKYSLAEHFVLARAGRQAGVALFHAPHYTLPLAWNGPAVVTIHDLIHVKHPGFFPFGAALYARAIAGAAARRARLVIADSQAARDDIVALLGVDPGRVRVVPLGVSPGYAPPPGAEVEAFRRAAGLPAGYVLYVGARKRHKNVGVVLEALARLGDAAPPLVLAGPPWSPDDPLARAARGLGIDGAVRFSGDLHDDAAMARLYAGASMLVQPSLIEGFGLPPLEAMACGVPVIASDIPALRETLEGAAVLVPPAEPDAWAAAIAAQAADGARREAFAAAGIARAARYTWAETAARTRAVYEEALAS